MTALPCVLPSAMRRFDVPFQLPCQVACEVLPNPLQSAFHVVPPYPLGAVARPLGRAGQPMNIVKSFVRPFGEVDDELNTIRNNEIIVATFTLCR